MVSALNLAQRQDRARHDEDGHHDVPLRDGGHRRLLFELKSAPIDKDFGTGRDTGLAQLKRWSTMHFAFGWFAPRDNLPQRMWYGSPAMMREWNEAERAYLVPDLLITAQLPDFAGEELVVAVLGDKDVYTHTDLYRIMKNNWNANAALGTPNQYLAKADVHRSRRTAECLYSPAVAQEAIRDRARYLLARGSTVNNRKIAQSYVKTHCQELTGPGWAVSLHHAITQALDNE